MKSLKDLLIYEAIRHKQLADKDRKKANWYLVLIGLISCLIIFLSLILF